MKFRQMLILRKKFISKSTKIYRNNPLKFNPAL